MVLCVSSVESSLSLSCGAVGNVASCPCWLSSKIGSGGRDDEDVVPLDLDEVMGCVILGDLFRHDRTNHAADGADAVGDAHQDGGVPRRNILKDAEN